MLKNFTAQNNNPVSEDCLKLNIWTKSPGDKRAKKAVRNTSITALLMAD
jgi:carboxylesterase type B